MRKKAKYYTSIYDCPQKAFNAGMRGDWSGMILQGRFNKRMAKKAYTSVFDEYVKEFGLPREYQEYLRTMVWAAEEYAESTKPGEKWRYTIAQVKEKEAAAMMSGGTSQPFATTCAQLSKAMGFAIDPNQVTVAQFYGYLQSIN